ncbi:MAG: hypothetical protein COA58_04160 [Bacteroidetes bacterium]|nr:MAG: hypothetical protein COA58_04160 [Bacteroidota bacterium]
MRIVFFNLVLLFISVCVSGQTDTVSIFINTGQHLLVDSSTVPAKAFNSTSEFKLDGQLFRFTKGQDVILQITNTDTIGHTIEISEYGFSAFIDSGKSVNTPITFSSKGLFQMYSTTEYPNQKYLGLSGLITVESNWDNSFYWNIKEFQSSYNLAVQNGDTIDFANYKPNYFLINGKSNPDIATDTLAKIRGKVGDTLTLHILNSGNSVHSLHFHGYHFKIIASSRTSDVVGWIKDTYPVYAGERTILQMVPDKAGEYPVHDHNLVATTANNYYPNGMFITMIITE